jgi:methyl-accepting chemotaxis protein
LSESVKSKRLNKKIMSMETKILTIILITFIILISITFGASNIVITNSFAELENKDTQQNTQRAVNALSASLNSLDVLNNNWSMWDDLYNYVNEPTTTFTDSNTGDSAFSSANLNLILITDVSGKIVYSKGFDLDKAQEVPIPEDTLNKLTDNNIISHTNTEDSIIGILSVQENPLMISSRPIIHSDGQGPIAGTIIMGQYLDASATSILSETSNLPITFERAASSTLSSDFQTAVSNLTEKDQVFVQPLDSKTVAGYSFINDIDGKPFLVLRIEMPRSIFAQGMSTLNYFMLLLIAFSLVFIAMVTVLVTRLIARSKKQEAERLRITDANSHLVTQLKDNSKQLTVTSEKLSQTATQSSDFIKQVSSGSHKMMKNAQEQSVDAQETAKSIEQLSTVIDQLSRGAQEQSIEVKKAVTAITEVSETMRRVADNTNQATTVAKHASESAQTGAQNARLTLSGMDKIKSSTSEATKKIEELGSRSAEIGKIVAVIDDIAAQTNLLALNAAIEAARAGEQGRGFAVVSEEVRKLAEKTTFATKEIANLIGNVQKGVTEATQVIEGGNAAVADGYNLAITTGRSLEQILEAFSEVNAQINQIAVKAQQVNSSTNDLIKIIANVGKVTGENTLATEKMIENALKVSKSIETVAGIAEENSSATEQVSTSTQEMISRVEEIVASSQTLKEMSVSLENSVSQFKVN